MSIINKLSRSRLIVAVFGLIGLFSGNALKAAEEPYVNSIRGTSVIAGAKFDVTDEKFLNLTAWNSIKPGPYSMQPENIVELKFHYDTSHFFYNKKFTAVVNLTIYAYNNPYDTSQYFTAYSNVQFKIHHDTAIGTPYKGVHYMKFSGAYKFRVVVNSVDCPELGLANMPKVLMIEGKTVIKRKYNFSGSTSDITKIEQPNGQIKLSWIPANYAGAELFDLEYTVVDDSSVAAATVRTYVAANTPLPATFLDEVFKNNATRVTLTTNSYTFDPLYQAGYLLFRVRGVQFGNEYRTDVTVEEQNIRMEGVWNYSAQKLSQPSYQLNVVQLLWHEPNLNWVYTVAFAEDGKNKKTIDYFDGLLRNRQDISLSNSDNKVVVAETFYDAYGRPTVNALPAPVNDSVIHYFQNFNRNLAGKGFSFKDMVLGPSCRIAPDKMSDVSGAEKYYSPANDINDYFFKKYIPKSEGYPFTVTEFTPDHTGRIASKSGTGKDLQAGEGHDTRYFYGKPTQEELDRLFGSEAGNASHYLKNMIVDPNKQISVQYINSTGQVVASALAGLTPPNVEKLSSNDGTGTDVVKNMLQPQDFTKDYGANILLGSSPFLAAVTGNYKFKYKLIPLRLDVFHGAANQFRICNTCYYDLRIYVRNNCGVALDSAKKLITGSTLFQTNCNEPVAEIIDSFTTVIGDVGQYQVSYELQVSEAAWKFYDSVHLAQNTNIRPFNSFLEEKLKEADFKGCFNECKTCLTELGTRTDFINNRIKPLFLQADSMFYAPEFDVWANALYDSLYAHCNSIQSGCTVSPCDEEKELLLEDVKPGGQYATYDGNYNPTELLTNVLTHRTEVWFYNEDGTLAQIEHDGVMKYANDGSIPWRLFIENFQDNWAEALIQFHPEYCFYLWCTYNSTSKAFENTINEIDSDAQATALGYFGQPLSLLNNDPFFQSGGYGYTYYSQMADSLNLFSRTIPGYSGPDLNILQYINYELYCEEEGIAPGSCSPSASCRSPYMEWILYREYYLNLKAYFFEKARIATPGFQDCKNCFIGTDNTELNVCTPPPASDFTVTVDPTYTGSGTRIIVKYKNGEAATSHKLRLTIYYSGGNFTQIFRSARATETYVVPSGSGFYVGGVICEPYGGGGGGTKSATLPAAEEYARASAIDIKVIDNAAVPLNCPCPTWDMFSVSTTGWQCWDGSDEIMVTYSGPEIPACRTVYVTIYYQDYWYGTSGYTTVIFNPGQTVAWGCLGGMQMDRNAKKSAPDSAQAARNLKLSPSANKGKDNRQPVKSYSESTMLKKGETLADKQTTELIPPCCGGGYYYFNITDVWCYDSPCFVCPGSEQPTVSLCKEDPRYELYKNKTRRYTSYQNPHALYQNLITTYSSQQSQVNEDITNNCQANCEAQADLWIDALKKCTTDQNILNNIRAGLIAVCQSGCDKDRPYGSSSNFNGTQTFQSVILQYLPGSLNDSCTADLISDPYPYDKQPQFEGRDVIRLETCIGTRFNALKTQYQSAVSSGYVGTFHQWLQKQLKQDFTLTTQDLTDLETAVNSGCKFLKKPFALPVALNCASTPACIDPATTLSTYNAFLAKYPGITSANQNYETLLTNYFNHAFGFALSFEDYDAYIKRCQQGTTNHDLLCNRAMTSQLIVATDVNGCMIDVFNLALSQAISEYNIYIDSVRQAFRMAYMAKCMNGLPSLTMSTRLFEYHYTLSYYDQAGNPVKTIPPQGVKLLNDAQVAQVQANRLNTNNYCYSNSPEYAFNASLFDMPRDLTYDNPANGQYTIEAWLKLSNFSDQGILSYNDVISPGIETGYHLGTLGGKLWFVAGTTPKLGVQSPVMTNFLSPNTWFHIAIVVNTYTAKPVKMYVNGGNVPLTYLNGNSAAFSVSPSHTHKLKLGGAFAYGATTYMSGSLKQFRLYHRLLTPAEVLQNAYNNCLLPTSTAGLVSHIPIYEGQGSFAEDKVTLNSGPVVGGGPTWTNYISGVYPNHRFPTTYEYNSLNNVVRKTTPDAGITRMWYDVMGRLVASQTAEQRTPKNPANPDANRYEYTKYDTLGRVVETGEKYGAPSLSFFDEGGTYDTKNPTDLNSWQTSGTNKQVTMLVYDKPNTTLVTNTTITNLQASNSRKRLITKVYKELASNPYYDFATHYVYDILGNVKMLFQDLKPMRDVELLPMGGMRGVRRFDYEFDLMGGGVTKLYYQKGLGDQFIYKFEYDSDNKLRTAYSSRTGLVWQKDASYFYYLHGPLARVEVGKFNVQGIDYAYTLQGWIKGINSQALDINKDMAGDGNPASPAYQKFSRDVFGYSLGFHSNDYKPIGGATANAFDLLFTTPPSPAGTTGNTGHQLFNGGVNYTTVAMNKINSGQTAAYTHVYDQLNRLTGTRQHAVSGSSWSYNSFNPGYEERVSYDANGNIDTYLRKGTNSSTPMDNLKYFYYYIATDNTRKEYDASQPLPADVKALTNQLAHVDDTEAPGNYPTDIDDQGLATYDYDNNGNLLKSTDSITSIDWTMAGKIRQVSKSNGRVINFSYDAMGNRVVKQVMLNGVQQSREFYIRDALGNVISVYKDQFDYVDWAEQHLYGKERLGVWAYGKYSPGLPLTPSHDSIMIGSSQYELNNHLGNVLVTITDKKVGVDVNADGVVDYYEANVLNAQDYYPFGMVQPGRLWRAHNANAYRYGFNKHEKDDEIAQEGNHLSFNDFGYDTRLARRWQVDPVEEIGISGYSVYKNNPIFYQDPDGESPISIFAKAALKAGLKKAAKELVESQIKKRLAAYLGKQGARKWATQLADDALTFIDYATATKWWEFLIEIVPVAGDAYGAAQLGKQGYRVWKGLEKFEKIAELGERAAKNAWKMLGANSLLKGKGAQKLKDWIVEVNTKFGEKLDDETIAGAIKEKFGLKSGFKADGTPFQHLKSYNDRMRGLRTRIEDLQKAIKAGDFEGDALKAAQGALNAATSQYNEIVHTMNAAEKAVKQMGKVYE